MTRLHYRMRTADGCPTSVIVDPTTIFPVGVVPAGTLRLKPDTLDPPLLGMKTQFPSAVIPPASGLAPVDTVEGDSRVRAPVTEL